MFSNGEVMKEILSHVGGGKTCEKVMNVYQVLEVGDTCGKKQYIIIK